MAQNSVAASGWGAPLPEEPEYSRTGSLATSEDGSDYTDYDYETEEDEEDDDYAPLQVTSWGAQPTGAQADVNAIQMPDWNERPRDETPSLTFTSADWGKLCDPNVVVKSGIGSGNLHRKGANYKPVDEQMILNQRLKIGSPIPSGKKKKRGGAKKPKPIGGPPRPSNAPKAPKVPKAPRAPPASRRPPLAQSAWGTSQLSSTPFWEAGGAKSSKYAANPSPAPAPPSAPAPAAAPKVQQRLPGGRLPPTGGAASRWASEPLQENYVPPAPQPSQQQQQQQQPVQAPVSAPTRPIGSAASKYAPAQLSPPPQQQPPQQQPPPQQPLQQQPQQTSAPIHGTISLHDNLAPIPPRKTIFQLNIELTPGVGAILPVYETDDYVVLVREFGKKHHLTISPEAEATFAEKIKLMVATLKKQAEGQ